ncbi:MAG: carboxylase [Bacteroidales bacterium]|nr:carboxylase [Bacteroidales bacterium]HNW74400.1 carboxylase [Bacteroidales bacterium]HPS50930.1 carboxylase [Bacteroidales bacterium]
MARRKLLIRDLTLRDGQQSLFATRMTQEQVDRVLPYYKEAGFYAMEVWGGAVPDSIMRYLSENPWVRLEKIKEAVGDKSKLTALSRGRNLFGYNPYPEEVIEGFNRNAINSGIGIMRIFDALNDVDNMKSTIKYVKQNGGLADCAISYTVDPKFSTKQKFRSWIHFKALPHDIFTIDYFVEKARQLEALGADMISIKDMAGLISPSKTGKLIHRLKEEVRVPIDFHTHCTPGFGLASVLAAIVNGVDIVDTNIWNFAGGPAAPAYELIHIFCEKLGVDTGVNISAVTSINKELREIRKELKQFDTCKELPVEFDFTTEKLPKDINKLFVKAIYLAKHDREDELLETCLAIEKHFAFPEPDEAVKRAEIPGGMYTNMLAQLKQIKLDHLLPRVLELVPLVRIKSGCPPLVTPTSQIVGVQAVNCVIDENKDLPFFTTKSIQFVNLVKGIYGRTPIPVDPDFREQLTGIREETPYDTKNYKKQENTVFEDYGDMKLAENEKEELLLELFPTVARDFLQKCVEEKYTANIYAIEEEKRRKAREARDAYERLSPQEKKDRLMQGLYSWHEVSYPEEENLGRS